jgi:hypothetical protein
MDAGHNSVFGKDSITQAAMGIDIPVNRKFVTPAKAGIQFRSGCTS